MSNYTIITYNEKYRDDMIFMVLEAKDALGRVPRLNEDLLDVQKNYIDTGDMFWLAIDEHDRVIGCIGYNSIPGTTEVKLHRLYIKAAHACSTLSSDMCVRTAKPQLMSTTAARSILNPAASTRSMGIKSTLPI